MHVYFNGKPTDASVRCSTDRVHFPTRRLPISHHFHGNTRDAEGFCTLLFTWAVVRMCFSPRFTSRVGCSPMETSVTHYPRARETFKKLFSSTFQRFKKLRVLSEFYSWIYIYIYKENAWKDAVKYREPDKNIG